MPSEHYSLTFTIDSRVYHWDSHGWIDGTTDMRIPEGQQRRLNDEYLRMVEESNILSQCDPQRRRFLFEFLHQQLGTPLARLCSCGFYEEVLTTHPEVAIAHTFSAHPPPSGRSLVNCRHLRDRFFRANPAKQFDGQVVILGRDPFDTLDLTLFLTQCNVSLSIPEGPVHAVVLGRLDWCKHTLDKIIDQSERGVLRVYSQEMIVSILAGLPDPFATVPLPDRLWTLYSFRSGHAGLEYVSNGWQGWVTGVRPASRFITTDWQTATYQIDRSPLSLLGYKVGGDGLAESSRRQVLRSAFEGPLPYVDSDNYMAAWGRPASADRLKRIAQHLANLLDTHRTRETHQEAVTHWQDDLNWLKETFYHGATAFSWPQI